jgi:phosphoserine phosphatase
MIPEGVREEIRRHRLEGRKIVLLSGMPEFILKHFAIDLGVDAAVGCRLETSHKRYTGRILGVHPVGTAKRIILQQIAKMLHIDLQNSSAYGNNYSDRFFLSITGTPVAVNPDRRLNNYAVKNNWLVIDTWTDASDSGDKITRDNQHPKQHRLGLEHWFSNSRN